jgi:hypothetical protein
MKALWNILSILAVANVIAIAGFVGWLRSSDRLNVDRAREVRLLLTRTLAQEKSQAEAAAKAQEAEKLKAEEEKKAAKPPLTATERLSARIEATELDRQRIERLKREITDLQNQLAADRLRLNAERVALENEKKQFQELLAASNTANTDAQFQKTLKVLQAQKPAQAVVLLQQMLADPAPQPEFAPVPMANGMPTPPRTPAAEAASEERLATVVGYLDAMNDKSRTKIIEALTKTDPKLAAELLERLRQRGEFARVP